MIKKFTAKHHSFPLDKTYVWGILNTTSDSFSDGGNYLSLADALSHGTAMITDGADVLDIGGESTRPGFIPVSAKEELARVLPTIDGLSSLIPMSIDTTKYEVAEEAINHGAVIINDIWGLSREPRLAALAAKHKTGLVIMHNQDGTVYQNILTDILSFFEKSIDIALCANVAPSCITLDVGIGFGKTYEQNLYVLKNLSAFSALGYPLFLGLSRKSVIGLTLDLPVNERMEGTLAANCLGIAQGANILRVHDVLETKRAAKMCDAILQRK